MAEAISHSGEPFSAEETGAHEMNAHEQIIYGSSSHRLKLPEVKQVLGEGILVFWRHQNSGTKPKEVYYCQEGRKAKTSLRTSNALMN